MAIYLDDQAADLAGTTLSDVFEAARSRLDPEGRLVIEVQLDGETLSPDALDDAMDQTVAGREVSLYTAEAADLATAALEQIEAALEDAKLKQEQAGELLQQDRAGEAMTILGEAVQTWLQSQQAMAQSASLAGVELNEVRIDDRGFEDLTQELIERLTELKSLIEAGDTVSLGDALQYEWPELNDRWRAIAAHLRDRVASAG